MHALITKTALAVAAAATITLGLNAPKPAQADEASTAAIAFGAAAIVGALLYDGSNRPYYVNDGRRFYVNDDQARSYRDHRDGYVPQRGYASNGYTSYGRAGYDGSNRFAGRDDRGNQGGYRSDDGRQGYGR